MKITHIIKRDGRSVEFDQKRIEIAVKKAMKAANEKMNNIPQKIAKSVVNILLKEKQKNRDFIPTVEGIQDMVERELMQHKCFETAKAYIRYRDWKASLRKRNIFKRRINLKPYEYPELIEYVDAIRHSYWLHTEFNFSSDIQDFKTKVNPSEQNAIKNATMAIAQVEVAVKTFWGDIYKKMPKPEIGAVGFTFAESEVRHMDAYAHLLRILGLENEFEKIQNIPALNNRIIYLEKMKKDALSEDNREFVKSLLFFSLFVEHISLFSQFLIIMSFNKQKNLFKGVSNAVEATSKEEQIHGLFGIDLINLIKDENPDWFNKEYENSIIDLCYEAYKAEEKIIDWILEKGELKFLSSKTIKNFIKHRLNCDLEAINFTKMFSVDKKLLNETEWFDDEVVGTKHTDFFFKRSINYSKRQTSITEEDIF